MPPCSQAKTVAIIRRPLRRFGQSLHESLARRPHPTPPRTPRRTATRAFTHLGKLGGPAFLPCAPRELLHLRGNAFRLPQHREASQATSDALTSKSSSVAPARQTPFRPGASAYFSRPSSAASQTNNSREGAGWVHRAGAATHTLAPFQAAPEVVQQTLSRSLALGEEWEKEARRQRLTRHSTWTIGLCHADAHQLTSHQRSAISHQRSAITGKSSDGTSSPRHLVTLMASTSRFPTDSAGRPPPTPGLRHWEASSAPSQRRSLILWRPCYGLIGRTHRQDRTTCGLVAGHHRMQGRSISRTALASLSSRGLPVSDSATACCPPCHSDKRRRYYAT